MALWAEIVSTFGIPDQFGIQIYTEYLFLQVILDKEESVIETYKFEMSFNNDASHRLAEADKVFWSVNYLMQID